MEDESPVGREVAAIRGSLRALAAIGSLLIGAILAGGGWLVKTTIESSKRLDAIERVQERSEALPERIGELRSDLRELRVEVREFTKREDERGEELRQRMERLERRRR